METECQVEERLDNWPYVKKCTRPATHTTAVPVRVRIRGIEYLCDTHAKLCIESFGDYSARLI